MRGETHSGFWRPDDASFPPGLDTLRKFILALTVAGFTLPAASSTSVGTAAASVTNAPVLSRGDVDGDGVVNFTDLGRDRRSRR